MLKLRGEAVLFVLVSRSNGCRNNFLAGSIRLVHHLPELVDGGVCCLGHQQATHAVDGASPPQVHRQIAFRAGEVGVERAKLGSEVNSGSGDNRVCQIASIRVLTERTQSGIHVLDRHLLEKNLLEVLPVLCDEVFNSP